MKRKLTPSLVTALLLSILSGSAFASAMCPESADGNACMYDQTTCALGAIYQCIWQNDTCITGAKIQNCASIQQDHARPKPILEKKLQNQ